MNEKDIDRIADKIIERMKTDKEIKTDNTISKDRKIIIRIIVTERCY